MISYKDHAKVVRAASSRLEAIGETRAAKAMRMLAEEYEASQTKAKEDNHAGTAKARTASPGQRAT